MIIYPTSEVTRYVNLRSMATKVKPFASAAPATRHRYSMSKINTKRILMTMPSTSVLQFKKLILHRHQEREVGKAVRFCRSKNVLLITSAMIGEEDKNLLSITRKQIFTMILTIEEGPSKRRSKKRK